MIKILFALMVQSLDMCLNNQSSRLTVKMSAMWNDFTVSTRNIRQAVCNNCSCQVSKGGTITKHFSTMAFTHNLKTQHPTQYAEYENTEGIHAGSPCLQAEALCRGFFFWGGGFLFKIIWNNWVIAVIESHISRLEVITLESSFYVNCFYLLSA